MPAALGRQAAVLTRLLDEVEAHAAWRWVELSCSLARGAGDAWSDIDAGLGVAEASWPGEVDAVECALRGFDEVVDVMRQPMAFGAGGSGVHVFVQYADGVQLSLVVAPAGLRPGLPPGAVALYDADGTLARPWQPSSLRASAEGLREWAFLGWIAVCDAVKYLARGSLWEAHTALGRGRDEAWKLYAAAAGADYPAFGLTSLLDLPEPALSPGMAGTVARLDGEGIERALAALADELTAASAAAAAAVPFDVPEAMATYAARLLASLRQ